MKVNTDGVLLGAAATLHATDRHVLDAGTGTGTIALMLAQRYDAMRPRCSLESITGIDIDAPSAAEAQINFSSSPWSAYLSSEMIALKNFCPPFPLNLIVSNPPYFSQSLLSPMARRSIARHTAGSAMSIIELCQYASDFLADTGRLSVVLPSEQENLARTHAISRGLNLFRVLRVRTTPEKPFSRLVLEFSKSASAGPCVFENLTIQDAGSYPENKNGYTDDYLDLTKDFYLFA